MSRAYNYEADTMITGFEFKDIFISVVGHSEDKGMLLLPYRGLPLACDDKGEAVPHRAGL